jgi:hypothetical protein
VSGGHQRGVCLVTTGGFHSWLMEAPKLIYAKEMLLERLIMYFVYIGKDYITVLSVADICDIELGA